MFDSPVFTKMSALATCLCAQIIADGLPETCFCSVVPGESPALDFLNNCTDDVCGMAWVRLSTTQMETGMGVESTNLNNCDAVIGFDLEVGIARCAPLGDEQGNPPSVEDYLASADLQIADMAAMRTAIMCCDEIGDFILGAYVPFGPVGGAVGGAWTVSLSEF